MGDVAREAVRWLGAASMVYAAYMLLRCPCDTLVSCKQGEFYAWALAPVAVVAAMNCG